MLSALFLFGFSGSLVSKLWIFSLFLALILFHSMEHLLFACLTMLIAFLLFGLMCSYTFFSAVIVADLALFTFVLASALQSFINFALTFSLNFLLGSFEVSVIFLLYIQF